MKKPVIIVSGKNGQLAKELNDLSSIYPQFYFIFFSKEELNIADKAAVENVFKNYNPSFFINCAAYTAVDKAETNKETAYQINSEAVGVIAKFCKKNNTGFIHISTDYVFDGTASKPYNEEDITHPINYYGYTKWMGEKLALENNEQSIIIRTSWVYSIYGNNFVKTMLRLMQERSEINVVNDQLGSPTYAFDLAEVIMFIVDDTMLSIYLTEHKQACTNRQSGIFHFSNDGVISWYDFALAIRDLKNINCNIHPIPTTAYPTPAKRPAWSAFDKEKIINSFPVKLKDWRKSLKICLEKV